MAELESATPNSQNSCATIALHQDMVGRCGVDPLPRRDEIYSLTVRAADFIYPNMRTVRDLRSPI
jgi:hypothetical protein